MQHLGKKEENLIAFNEALDNVKVCLGSKESLCAHTCIMVGLFRFIEIEVTWLDEVAEGLKNVVQASHLFRNFADGLKVEISTTVAKLPGY